MKMMVLSDVDVTGIDSMNTDEDEQQYSSSSSSIISSPRQTARNSSAITPTHDVLSAVCCPHDDTDQHDTVLDTIGQRYDCESDAVQAIKTVKIAGDKRKLPTDMLLDAIEEEEETKKYPKVEEF